VTEHSEALVKLGLTLAALAVLAWRARMRPRDGKAGAALGLLGVLGAAAYFNFLTFHGGRFIHFAEMFHYELGSKYFPELGYDGLYVASLEAQAESAPALPLPRVVRDLRTNTIVPVESLDQHRGEVRKRFAPQRWRRFVADHAAFLDPADLRALNGVRLDHGYNPTPAWTFVGRLFNAWVPLDATTLPLMAVVDWLVLAATFVVVFRTFGSAVGATALVVFGAGYPWRYAWVGGAFLRYDWLAAVVVGICLLKRRRFAGAGVAFAYAAAVRLFPAFLLLGVAALAVRDLLRRADLRWALRFAAGLGAGAAACVLAGSLTGRGFAAWGEFARDIARHHENWSTNAAGLELVFLDSPQTLASRIPPAPLQERWAIWQEAMNRAHEARRPFYLAAALMLVAGVAAAAAARPADEGAALGAAVVFAALVLSCYYWAVFVALVLRRGAGGAIGVLGANAAALVAALATDDTQVVFGVYSWAMTVALAVLLAPAAVQAIRSRWQPVEAEADAGTGEPARPAARNAGRSGRRAARGR